MRKKLFATYVVIILFLSAILGFFSISTCKKYYIEEYSGHLKKEVSALTYILEDKFKDYGNAGIESFTRDYAEKFQYRITVISSDGFVISDSQADASALENHGGRQEIEEAMKGNTVVVTRYSKTLGTDYIYTAAKAETRDGFLILRLSQPLTELVTMQNQVIVYIASGITLAAFIAFLFAYFFAERIANPLTKLTLAVEEMAQGRYGKKIPSDSKDQIGLLTNAFNQMSSELTNTIEQLEDENMKLESIVNSMINGVVAIDGEDRILMINSECHKLFHIKINNVIGYNFYDVIRNETVYRVLDMSMKHKTHVAEEFTLRSGLEGTKILRIYANPILRKYQSDNTLGTLLVFQDVTQIRKLEQLRSDFVSNVTHELKTPLTSIMGFTDTLKAGALHDTQAALHFIDIIDIEAQRLYRLIQDILSLSEIETRNDDINVSDNNIKKIAENICEFLRPTAEKKGLKLTLCTENEIKPFCCNRDRISQMFINLIDNAIKYTEEGSVSVLLRDRGRHLEIIVADTGIGIPKEAQERIFERFYRVDKGRSRKAGGTGLGLSIVKHIVLLYNGSLRVESVEGEGSVFTIILPYGK